MVESGRRIVIDIRWAALLKVIAAAALVWAWLRLVELVLVVVVAVLLAVTLNPVIDWFERHGWARWSAAALVFIVLIAGVGVFGWLTWTSIADQGSFAFSHLSAFERDLMDRLPSWIRDAIGGDAGAAVPSALGSSALRVARSTLSALVVGVLALILTLYLVVEAESTREWLLAFVPKRKRPRAEQTLDEAHRVVFAYVAGNVLTSVLAGVFVFVLLTISKVPAALLLALIAALFDFVPVIGFIASGIFAIAMALTVSPTTGLIVGALYGGYHLAENYLISPWAYGDRLKLSNVAVILAFAVGATLAGVIGALIALPVAAAYPAIERIWLRDALPPETVGEHRAIEQKG
jgi:predicted PurR-regulated permease PerM